MISQTVNGLERRIRFTPAFHKVHEDPKKNYGVHGVEIHFQIVGPKGAVHFILSTGMMLNETYKYWDSRGVRGLGGLAVMGVDVGYHSPTPKWVGQEVRWPKDRVKKDKSIPEIYELPADASDAQKNESLLNTDWVKIGKEAPVCDLLGVPCYTDGSAMRADEWKDIFLAQGDEPIWKMLEEEYHSLFTQED